MGDWEDISIDEIADITGFAPETINSWIDKSKTGRIRISETPDGGWEVVILDADLDRDIMEKVIDGRARFYNSAETDLTLRFGTKGS